MNWIEKVVDDHREFEPPLNFWRWAAIATISAVVKDNVWLGRQIYNLYPNIYVMFHANSGLKKGPPVNMAAKLVKAVNNTRVIRGRSSIQGILKELGQAYSAPGGKVINKAVAFICSSELSSSIVEDKIATTILTDLYDRNYNVGEWRSLLKMETFDLKDPTITMLTATNEAHAGSFFERKDIRGGYFARTFIIFESEENRSNSLLVPLKNPINYDKYTDYLKQLSRLSGEFKPLAALQQSDEFVRPYTDRSTGEVAYYSEAGIIYQEWYDEFKEMIKFANDPTGTINRFGDSVLKVALLLSLARSPELYIDPESMQQAIEICQTLLGNVQRTTLGKTGEGDSADATRKTILIEELMRRDNHMMSRQQLHKKYWLHGTRDEWDDAVLSFEAAGIIKIKTERNNLVLYEMVPEFVREMTEFYTGKIKKKRD